MKYVKAYDLPLRLFHWIFAALFVSSFFIANVIDDDSALFAYHMLSGILMACLVILRIFWGFLGSKTSRFSSFQLSPKGLINYFRELFLSTTKRHLGHNPASSYAGLVMMILVFTLVGSGLMMINGINKHFFEEAHELFANGFLVLVIAHIAGVFFHQLKHRDSLAMSMLHGKKQELTGKAGISSEHKLVAIAFIVTFLGLASFVLKNYDSTTGAWSGLGLELQLNEEHSEHERHSEHD